MAQRRMFNKSITNSSKFLKMPMTSRLLYYDLGMNADDDGFVEHFMVLRMTGATQQDLGVLEANGLIKIFDENVLWIKDWKENNYIQKDRYQPSKYLQVYELDTICIQDVYTGKDRLELGKDSKDKINSNTTTIYEYVEQNFGRPLSPTEVQKIESWLLSYEPDIIKYAIEIATLNNKRTFNYVNGILKNWKTAGYKALQEIKDNEINKKEDKPMTKEEKETMDFVNNYDWLEDEV